MAPETGLAYISYYTAGFRVVTYGRGGIEQVGAFIDEGGNDFWGRGGTARRERGAVRARQRSRFGLYIFQYTP